MTLAVLQEKKFEPRNKLKDVKNALLRGEGGVGGGIWSKIGF